MSSGWPDPIASDEKIDEFLERTEDDSAVPGAPPGFDPTCETCNIDRHVCPGCGENLQHGQTSCGSC